MADLLHCNNCGEVVHTYAFVTEQHNSVLSKERWISVLGR